MKSLTEKLSEVRTIKSRYERIKFANHDSRKLQEFAQIRRDIATNLIGENGESQVSEARSIVESMQAMHFSTERKELKECADLLDLVNKIDIQIAEAEHEARQPETRFNKGTDAAAKNMLKFWDAKKDEPSQQPAQPVQKPASATGPQANLNIPPAKDVNAADDAFWSEVDRVNKTWAL